MSMTRDEIMARVAAAYSRAQVSIDGADCNFSIAIVADEFSGLRPVQRQQAVLKLFADVLATGELHAMTVSAKTPDEVANELNADNHGLTAISG
ncbi:MAG: BolA/IbaG family iron-sulfur metabolism protein [Pseudomonas sp.]|nr:BolA/IbaG family iron-sulfur metabolism protein [Pseudomonas sp.]